MVSKDLEKYKLNKVASTNNEMDADL
jgi:hypothetical protein